MSSFFSQPFVADENQANAGGDYKPIPEGVYSLLINKSELTKSKSGFEMVKMELAVDGGEFDGRKLFENMMLEHTNPQVVEISKKKMHALVIMCGLKQIDGAEDLLGQSFKAKVRVKKDNATGQLSNEVVFALTKPDAKSDAPKAEVKPTTTKKSW